MLVPVFDGVRVLIKDNHLPGKFELMRIPPAPHGLPQIEAGVDYDHHEMARRVARRS